MKQTEKDQLIQVLKDKMADWNTQYNLGRNKGLEEAIDSIQEQPVDPEETEEHF